MCKIALIILNWNNAPDTIECLESCKKLKYSRYEIIVVDNGSTDNSFKQIKIAFPHHHYVENEKNLGFAEGNNRGLAFAKKRGFDLLMLLNNDTIVHPKMLSEIAKAANENPKVGAFGPKIYYYDEPATIWYAGGWVDPKTGRCHHIGIGKPEGFKEPRLTEYICGCAIAIRPTVLDKVGYLDPRFFLNWEEIDWCYRMRKEGFECLFVPKAFLWHKVSASFEGGNKGGDWQYYYQRNRLLFHRKNFPFSKRWKKRYLLELNDLIFTLLNPKTPEKKRKLYLASIEGIRDYFFNRFGPRA